MKALEAENQKLQKGYDDLKELLEKEIRREISQNKMNLANLEELHKKALGIDLKL